MSPELIARTHQLLLRYVKETRVGKSNPAPAKQKVLYCGDGLTVMQAERVKELRECDSKQLLDMFLAVPALMHLYWSESLLVAICGSWSHGQVSDSRRLPLYVAGDKAHCCQGRYEQTECYRGRETSQQLRRFHQNALFWFVDSYTHSFSLDCLAVASWVAFLEFRRQPGFTDGSQDDKFFAFLQRGRQDRGSDRDEVFR